MTRLPSAGADHGERVGLPAVVEQLLIDVVADGFMLYCCGPRAAPNALVASYDWGHHVDLLVIRYTAQPAPPRYQDGSAAASIDPTARPVQ